jgi:hypothetical protein
LQYYFTDSHIKAAVFATTAFSGFVLAFDYTIYSCARAVEPSKGNRRIICGMNFQSLSSKLTETTCLPTTLSDVH